MTPFSSRYLVPLLVMLLVAAVPVTAHYVVGMPNEDCENPAALKRLLINGANKAGEWSNRYSYAVSQFTRGEVQGARFLWVRSSVPQPFYGERPFDTPGRYTDGPSQLERVQVDGVEVPIRVWQQQVLGHTEVTAIMMIYDGRPVEGVFEPSLNNAVETMFNGPLPVNFVGITGMGPSSVAAASRQRLVDWLAGSWTHYRRSCGPQ
ncbi:MAG: hypothetical protein VCE43_09715 [Myxococcota bacterium]